MASFQEKFKGKTSLMNKKGVILSLKENNTIKNAGKFGL